MTKNKSDARIVILDVPEDKVFVGTKQCVFRRSAGRLIGTMNSKREIKITKGLKYSTADELTTFLKG